MANLFFDLLPYEIRHEIYSIRLYNALARNYYKKVAQKFALAKIVLKLDMKKNLIMYDFAQNSIPYRLYFNPINSDVRYVVEKCCDIITTSDDKVWWISQLIRPIEIGLIVQGFTGASWSNSGSWSYIEYENYIRTEYAVDRLIEIFGCRRNPHRRSSLS
tara:strand:+ start:225 stop:704 length:480 start_codon:yes stop_codon:yes gene_type:complete